MKLSDLDWGEPEIGGLLKTTHSVAEARFRWQGHDFVAVEWFHRTGHLLHPYASLILIAEECDKTSDGDLLKAIAFHAPPGEDGAPRLVHAASLGRQVVLIRDARDRDLDLAPALAGII